MAKTKIGDECGKYDGKDIWGRGGDGKQAEMKLTVTYTYDCSFSQFVLTTTLHYSRSFHLKYVEGNYSKC